MKSKEEQEGLKVKFLQSLDIIEKKMDKEIDTSSLEIHKSLDYGRKTNVVDKHLHHS
jgi:hypothetical protein